MTNETNLPEPLTPPDCDLRGLPFMPLDVVRLTDSDLFAISSGEEFKAAITLWCKSWLQVPAASLPSDDRILAHLSGAGTRWKKVKEIALRGFIPCSDGRLYHAIVAEKANEAWERRGDWQEKQANKTERQRRWRERLKELSAKLREHGVDVPRGASLETMERLLVDNGVDAQPSTVDDVEIGKTGTGTGTGTVSKKEEGDAAVAASTFAFEGRVIRLNDIDLAKWRKVYHAIPDLDAELLSLDAWFQGDGAAKAAKWFHTASGALNRKHQEIISGRQESLPVATAGPVRTAAPC